MADFKTIRDSAVRWAVFGSFAALFMGWIAYALTHSWTDPSALRGKTAGNQLQSSQWNLLVGNVDNLNERLTNAETSSGIVPTGAVMAFFWTSCPNGWSAADGTANGVKKTDGASGTLDLRGEFIRGLDSAWIGARNVDTGRALGSSQSDILQGHEHSLAGLKNTAFWAGSTHWNNAPWYSDTWSSQLIGGPISDGTNWTPRTGAETRPRNVALLYCVKN